MAYIADRRPLTRQPQHFTRLAEEYQGRVGFCFVASNPLEMVSGRALSQRNGTHTMQVRPNMAAQATAPQGALYPAGLTLTNSPQIAALQSGMFALWVGSITQADTTYFSLFSRYGTTSHTGAFYSGMWRLCVNASGYVELVIDGDTAQSTLTSGLQVAYNQPLVIGFEVRDTSIVFWLNGARDEVTGVDVAATLGSVAVQINVGATQWAFDGHRYARCQMAAAAQERLPLARLAFNPWQILAGDVDDTWFSSGGGGPTATGRADETDVALGLSAVQIKATGQSSETDTALALSAVQSLAVGLADEVDSAFALVPVQLAPVGLASETDAAFALAAGSANAVGTADETDSAFALSAVQIAPVGLATETDAALALVGLTGTAPGIASETDTAFALAAVQRMMVGIASEVDTALALSPAAAPGYELALILKILRNRQELNPSTGKFTLYDDDGTTVLLESNAWADAGGTIPYSGGTLARLDALI